jgi:hypothetical protein
VAAGGPQIPSLKQQLKIGGPLVIPVGADQRTKELVRVTRISSNEYRSEDIADVRFVPLIGEEGWGNAKGQARAPLRRTVPPVSYVDAALAEILPTPQNHFRRSKRLISIR